VLEHHFEEAALALHSRQAGRQQRSVTSGTTSGAAAMA
jgi:hypothetical protein